MVKAPGILYDYGVKFEQGIVVENAEMGPGHWLLVLKVPAPLPEIKPGQFLTLRCDPHDQHSLLRPFSILDTDPFQATLSVYYKHLGRMSSRLSEARPGAVLDCLYPLGHGFPWHDEWRRVALVGGGVGIAPLLYLSTHFQPVGATMQLTGFFGGGSAADLVPSLLARYDFPQQLATMDGSLGAPGTVVELFRRSPDYFDVIYSCGPNPMLAALKASLPPDSVAFASLEEYMACGVGACYGCPARISEGGAVVYRTVCKDGPVFDLRQVVFE